MNILKSESVLNEAQIIKSENGKYFLTLEYNGNVVVYKGRPFALQNALWSTNTNKAHNPHPYKLQLNPEGNLVLFDAKSKKIWSSNTAQNNGAKDFRLLIENDGILMIKDANDEIIWQTKSEINTNITSSKVLTKPFNHK